MAFEHSNATAKLSMPLFDSHDGRLDLYCEWSLTAPVSVERVVTISAGNNDIRPAIVGTNYQLCIIIPPPGIADAWTLKGIAGDTGFEISTSFPTFLPKPSTSGLLLNAFIGGYTVLTRWYR